MHTGIQIGSTIDRPGVEAVVESIVKVFEAGQKFNMDQETIRESLNLISKIGRVEGATLSDLTVKGDTHEAPKPMFGGKGFMVSPIEGPEEDDGEL